MRYMRILVASFWVLLFSSIYSANAIDSRENFRVIADYSCVDVLNGSDEIGVLAYVQGFTTATNVWVSGKRDHFKGMTASEVLIRVKSVCKENNLGTLGATLTHMVSDLL